MGVLDKLRKYIKPEDEAFRLGKPVLAFKQCNLVNAYRYMATIMQLNSSLTNWLAEYDGRSKLADIKLLVIAVEIAF